jgi:predicted nucleic acid-binding protein
VSLPPSPIGFDTSVIINFCVVGRLGLLVRCVPPPRYLVVDVRDELEDANSRRLVDRMIERRELLVVVATEPAQVMAAEPTEVPVTQPIEVLTTEPAELLTTEPAELLTTEPAELLTTEPGAVLAARPGEVVATQSAALPGRATDRTGARGPLGRGERATLDAAAARGWSVAVDEQPGRRAAARRVGSERVTGTVGILRAAVGARLITPRTGDVLLTRMIRAGYYSPVASLDGSVKRRRASSTTRSATAARSHPRVSVCLPGSSTL